MSDSKNSKFNPDDLLENLLQEVDHSPSSEPENEILSHELDLKMESEAPLETNQIETANIWNSLEADSNQKYTGPSAESAYQSFEEVSVDDQQMPNDKSNDEQTHTLSGLKNIDDLSVKDESLPQSEETVAAEGFAKRQSRTNEIKERVVIGSLKSNQRGQSAFQLAVDAGLTQADHLRLAQDKIISLEKENDRLRQENEEVTSAADIIKTRLEESSARQSALEREKEEIQQSMHAEMMILKGNLQYKESEVAKLRLKVDELETRLKIDFKKIRVKERELENRLELLRAEKTALGRAKDEHILELKRKIEQAQSEIDNYREKLLESNKTIEIHQDQFRRTVRALRLALTNLEAKEEAVIPFKKAE